MTMMIMQLTERGADPRKAERSLREVSIRENISKAVEVVIRQRVEVQEVTDVNVLLTERILWVGSVAVSRRVYLHGTKTYQLSLTVIRKMNFDTSVSKWMRLPPHQPADLHLWPPESNQVISRASEYSMAVLSKLFKPFMRLRGNEVSWMNGRMNE